MISTSAIIILMTRPCKKTLNATPKFWGRAAYAKPLRKWIKKKPSAGEVTADGRMMGKFMSRLSQVLNS
jgi:hypothetical protein